jgi:predicted neuraminidase
MDVWAPLGTRIDGARGSSFPSGHAAFGALFAVVGSAYWPKRRWQWWCVGLVLPLSRWILNRHYLSDLWVGGCIGAYTGMAALLAHPPLPRWVALRSAERRTRRRAGNRGRAAGSIGGSGMPESPYFRSRPIFEEIPNAPSAHGSTICELPSGRLMAAWYSGSREGAGDVAIYGAYLAGEGGWGPPLVLEKSPTLSEGNPVLFPAPDGRLVLFWVTKYGGGWASCRIKSRDAQREGERAWGPVEVWSDELGYMTRHKPLVMSNGEILLPLYDEREWASFFAWSSDGGRSWARGSLLRSEGGNIQPTVVEMGDGHLVSLFRCGGNGGRLWRSESADYGRTWSPLERIDLPNPNSGADMVLLRSGAIALAFNKSTTERTPLALGLSTDGARTFPIVRDVVNGPGEYSYPAIIESRDGRIQLTYTHERRVIRHVTTNEAWISGL